MGMAFVVKPRIVKIHFADCSEQYLCARVSMSLQNVPLEIDLHVSS
jgi:hypothetical protein